MKTKTALITILIAFIFSFPSYGADIKTTHAVLRALDKITGRATTIIAKVYNDKIDEKENADKDVSKENFLFDESSNSNDIRFGNLKIRVRACFKTPPEETPENAAFIQVVETKPKEEPMEIFSGWMFSSTPALSALEHPVYDIWVLKCGSEEEAEILLKAENKKFEKSKLQAVLPAESTENEEIIETDD